MRRALLALMIPIALAGCGRPGGAAEERSEPRVPVRVERIARTSVTQIVTSTGTVKARDDVPINAEAGGRVEEVAVRVGDRVSAGDVLLRLDAELAELAFRQAEAQVLVAEAQLEDAEASLERTRSLWQSGDVADAEFEAVERAAKSARAGLAAAEAGLGSADRQLRNTAIETPIGGTVAFVYAKRGHQVAIGSPVAHVVDDDVVEIELGLSEDQISDLRPGRSATVRVRALRGESFTGRVEYVGRRADDMTKTYPVRVVVKNRAHLLRSGMVAEVEIVAREYSDVVAIERDWIVERYGEPAVYVAADSVAVLRKLALGRTIGSMVIVASGLEEDDEMITFGHDRVSDGAAIDIKGEHEDVDVDEVDGPSGGDGGGEDAEEAEAADEGPAGSAD